MSGTTISEKILAKAAGVDRVTPGEIVTCQVDLAMAHDSSGPRRAGKLLDELGVPLWDLDKVVIITDHYVNLPDADSQALQDHAAAWCRGHAIKHFIQEKGICHVVLPEHGLIKPGMFCVGADSHSTTAGAFGCFMVGIGATEMTGVFATGEIWVRVPESVKIDVTGRLQAGVSAKDIVLKLCGDHGIMGFNYQVVEYTGSAIRNMEVQDRMVLTNMAAELGAKTGIVEADEKTKQQLAAWGATDIDLDAWRSDADATYASRVTLDGDTLEPQVAAPSSPENADIVSAYKGVRLDQAYIGACTGAKLEDLQMAASIVKGKKIASDTKFYVAPSTYAMRAQAEADGTLQTLSDAGAEILPSGCGGCIGLGPAGLAENAVGISSTNRNFVGRAGPKSSKLYLASPFTVAASALTGEITDPREFLA